MTGKIKLTREQEGALRKLSVDLEGDIEAVINTHAHTVNVTRFWACGYKPLNELTTSELARALLIGYEVEPKYKEGDWVHVSGQKGLYEITCLSGYYADLKGLWGNRAIKNLRHATPEEIAEEKERRLWKSLKRDVKEFKNGDVGVMRNGMTTSSLRHLEDYSDDLVGFYPIESFIKFGGDE